MARRVALGKLADGTFGLRVSRAGCDADANPPVPGNLIFDSNWPYLLPVLQTGVLSTGHDSVDHSISFPTLPYAPMFEVYTQSNDGTNWSNAGPGWVLRRRFQSEYEYTSGYTSFPYLQIWVTNSNFNVYYWGGAPAYNGWPTSISIAYVIYNLPLNQ